MAVKDLLKDDLHRLEDGDSDTLEDDNPDKPRDNGVKLQPASVKQHRDPTVPFISPSENHIEPPCSHQKIDVEMEDIPEGPPLNCGDTSTLIQSHVVNTFLNEHANIMKNINRRVQEILYYEDMRKKILTSTENDCGQLPQGWDLRLTGKGTAYYVNRDTKMTTWDDPRLPASPDEHDATSTGGLSTPAKHEPEKQGTGAETRPEIAYTVATATQNASARKPMSPPIVDVGSWKSAVPSERKRIGDELLHSLQSLGFVAIINHGITPQRQEEILRWSKKLFDLPLHQKRRAAHFQGGTLHRHYSWPKREECFKEVCQYTASELSKYTPLDSSMMECYHVGSADDPNCPKIQYLEKIMPGLRDFIATFRLECDNIAAKMLHALALGLNLIPTEFFRQTHQSSNNYMQLIHYPPCASGLRNQSWIGTDRYGDLSSITLRFQDDQVLQFENLNKRNDFTKMPPPGIHGLLFVSAGEALSHLSNQKLAWPRHAVGFSPKHGYQLEYYVNPSETSIIECLPNCVSLANPAKYEPITWHDLKGVIRAETKKGSEVMPKPFQD